MPLNIPTRGNVRVLQRRYKAITLGGYVAKQPTEEMLMSGGGISNPLRFKAANPEWKEQPAVGIRQNFQRHNNFKDQELIARLIDNSMLQGNNGSICTYTVKSFDPSNDPVWHEDNTRAFVRCFDIPIIMKQQPSNELYKALGIDSTDKFDAHVSIKMFLQFNYQNLRELGLEPLGDPRDHNPILHQRGGIYGDFNYHGYLACQIFPTPGDVIKLHAYDMVYRLETYTDFDPEIQFLERKFMWKMSFSVAVDDGSFVSDDVISDPRNENVMESLFGKQGVITADNQGETMSESQFDVTAQLNEINKDNLFKPIQVKDEKILPSSDGNFYPEYSRNGGW